MYSDQSANKAGGKGPVRSKTSRIGREFKGIMMGRMSFAVENFHSTVIASFFTAKIFCGFERQQNGEN
jgi:hypothetical protein